MEEYVYPHEQAAAPAKPENPFLSVHLPLTFISVALALFFVGESKSVNNDIAQAKLETNGRKWAQDNLVWRKTTGEKGLKDLLEAKDRLEKAVEERKALVDQSTATQAQFTSVMKELDELAKGGDKDAALIITSYGVKVNDAEKPAEKPAAKPAEKPAEAAKPK